MAFQTWQIGLDIQNGQFCSLAIQRRRDGWQLRHWWRQRLPQDTLRNGVLQSSPELLTCLRQWRSELPQRYSLRVGLPAQLVLQRTLPLPEISLREPELGRYVEAAARRLFPLEPQDLALDYRAVPDGRELSVTAARQTVVQQWLAPLELAGFRPCVFELTTAALAVTARQCPLPTQGILVHRRADHWLWYQHSEQGQGGMVTDCSDFLHLLQHLPAAGEIWLSGDDVRPDEPDTHPFSPFQLLRYQQPPLPDNEGAFTLAAGLALRQEDDAWWR